MILHVSIHHKWYNLHGNDMSTPHLLQMPYQGAKNSTKIRSCPVTLDSKSASVNSKTSLAYATAIKLSKIRCRAMLTLQQNDETLQSTLVSSQRGQWKCAGWLWLVHDRPAEAEDVGICPATGYVKNNFLILEFCVNWTSRI